MENASKALLMAGSILIGLMIIALGVYVANNMQEVDTAYDARMSTQEILKFNQDILKNLNYDETDKKYKANPQQLVTIKNIIGEINGKYGANTVITNAGNIIGNNDADFLNREKPIKDNEGNMVTNNYSVMIDYGDNGQINNVVFT